MELEKELVEVLPERVETSYATVTVNQGNLGIQIGGGGQALLQGNAALVFVTQGWYHSES